MKQDQNVALDEKLKEIYHTDDECMHKVDRVDALKSFIEQHCTPEEKGRLEAEVFRSITIEKQMTAVKKVEDSREWHMGCHGLKWNNNFSHREFTDINVYRRRKLAMMPCAKDLGIHKLQPTLSSCTTMNKAKKAELEDVPSYVTLHDMETHKDQIKYKLAIPSIKPQATKHKTSNGGKKAFRSVKLLKHYPYGVQKSEQNILIFVEKYVNHPDFDYFTVDVNDSPDKVYEFPLQNIFDGASRHKYYTKKVSPSHVIYLLHTPFLTKNNQSPESFQLHALYFSPEAAWNTELCWKYFEYQLQQLQGDRGYVTVKHDKLDRMIRVKIELDFICVDTPSVRGLLGGNDLGSNWVEGMVDGVSSQYRHTLFELDVAEIKLLAITDNVMKMRAKIRDKILHCRDECYYKLNEKDWKLYCSYDKFPKIFLMKNPEISIAGGPLNLADYPTFNRNTTVSTLSHFQWYRLRFNDPRLVDVFDDVQVVPLMTKDLQKIRNKVQEGITDPFTIQLTQSQYLRVTIDYKDANNTRFELKIEIKNQNGQWIECHYFTDGPHAFFHEYMVSIDIIYVCVMHIIENIALDILQKFAMYMIAIIQMNEKFDMDSFCDTLRHYFLIKMAGEFAEKKVKYRMHKVKLNAKDSINFICNFPDIINDIIGKMPYLTDGEIFILYTFKYFVFKNALYMDKLWRSHVKSIEELDELILEGMTIMRFWNSMMPQSSLVKPRWPRYAITFPLNMMKLYNRAGDRLNMNKISMEGPEHFHKKVKDGVEHVDIHKLMNENGEGCAMLMNDLQIAAKNNTKNGLDKESRSRKSGRIDRRNGKLTADQIQENKIMDTGIRGHFYRTDVGNKGLMQFCNEFIVTFLGLFNIIPIFIQYFFVFFSCIIFTIFTIFISSIIVFVWIWF